MPKPIQTIGSRRQVMNGTAKKTSGGLTKSHLMMSHGRIVSRAKHFTAKKEMRLVKYGYGTQKGKFGAVKLGTKKHRKGHKKMRGGSATLSPAELSATETSSSSSSPMSGGSGMVALSPAELSELKGGSGMARWGDHGDANWSGDQSLKGGRGRCKRCGHRHKRGNCKK